jgi:membrane-associated phospholipid phosphatase
MEKKFATAISYIAHPLCIPMLGLLIISNSGTYAADLDERFNNFIYTSVFVLTFLMPIAFIPFYLYAKMIRNIQFAGKRERLIPLYITLVFYLVAYFMVRRLPVSSVYQRFLFASCISVLLVLTISYFWKISAHMVGWGGLTGLIASLSLRFHTDMMIFLIVAILLSGITAFARLSLGAHNQAQVYSGFLLGIATVLLVFLI